ncbi:MAG: Maf family nucleotide pyrophosphatase [Pseudomonadales bacterium]|nr:Maf family nucleotide pyrophosphatase [Pseudomonadales bacterium]
MTTLIILASTSSYRSKLLSQLGLPFTQIDPRVIETIQLSEDPRQRASRLATDKAIAGAALTGPPALIIGSDQVAHINSRIFSKPGNYETAFKQLRQSSDQWVSFSTAISLCNQSGSILATGLDTYEIKFRPLTDKAIEHYLTTEQPYDCAGSIKAEALGITLIAETRGKDINTLYGLPLILLVDLLAEAGLDLLNYSQILLD